MNMSSEDSSIGVSFGLALALLGLGLLVPGNGEALEWRLYLLLGTAFPAMLFAIGLWPEVYSARKSWRFLIDRVLPFFATGTMVFYLVENWDAPAALLSLCSLLILSTIGACHRRSRAEFFRPLFGSQLRSIFTLLLILTTWHAALHLMWWRNFSDMNQTGPPNWKILFGLITLIFIGIFLRPLRRVSLSIQRLLSALAIGLILLCSLRLPLIESDIFHHLSFFIGPADLVKKGGWLLWDVPSQYGFLNILLIAKFPGLSSWEALRVVMAGCQVFAASFIFLVLFASHRNWPGFVCALGLSVCTVFLWPGWALSLSGPEGVPSTSAFRFLWLYVLLAVTLWESRLTNTNSEVKNTFAPLLGGSVAWVLATLWSAESCVYATATWIPALVWSRFQLARMIHGPAKNSLAVYSTLKCLCLPFGLLFSTWALLAMIYHRAIGEVPDLLSYFEFARAYSAGFGTMPIQPAGAVWALFTVFIIQSAALLFWIRKGNRSGQIKALGGWGAVWAVSSYFISRSHDNNICNIVPILIASFGVTFFSQTSEQSPSELKVLRLALVPLLTVLTFLPFSEENEWKLYAKSVWRSVNQSIQTRRPQYGPGLSKLFHQAGVQPHDHVTYLGDAVLPLLPLMEFGEGPPQLVALDSWLPFAPVTHGDSLPEDRVLKYLERFHGRRQFNSGWLLRLKDDQTRNPVLEYLKAHYKATKVFTNRRWQLEKYVARNEAAKR